MTVRAHSIARVYCTPGEDPANCKGLGARLRDAIERVEANEHVPDDARDSYWEVLFELFDAYGYGAVGDSNSVWGRQHRLIADNDQSGREEALRSAARALGLIVQETSDPHERRDLNVFAPSLDRFVGYDHPMNAPLSEAVVVEHNPYRGTPYIEVGGERTVLDELFEGLGSRGVAPTRDERAHGVLAFKTTALWSIEQVLREAERPYSVHDSYVDSLATREWVPGLDDASYLALKEERGWSASYRVHAIGDDGSDFACGTTVSDRSEYRVLRPETVLKLDEMTDSVAWCGHAACKKRLPERERDESVKA